jgi:hypothetical protein
MQAMIAERNGKIGASRRKTSFRFSTYAVGGGFGDPYTTANGSAENRSIADIVGSLKLKIFR